ncbi:MAG: hypothetical protein ABW217_04870 [Polyangiaceae bacterium]
MTTALATLLAQSCLLPEVELSDEPEQGRGTLVGQGGDGSTASGTGGNGSGGSSSNGSSSNGSSSGGSSSGSAAGGSSAGTGGTLAPGAGGTGGDTPPPTDLTPGSGGSAGAVPIEPEATCDNGSLDVGESDVDCAGPCAACADGSACNTNTDCSSGRCADGLCAPRASCQDGVLNQDETAIDCGGSTCSPRCAASQTCRADGDCGNGLFCGSAGVCAAPSCGDQRQNGDETAADCGGSCAPCAPGATCVRAADCTSQRCTNGVCAAPSCSDGIQNQSETAVDCGGPCGLCAPGQACSSAAQCSTNLCAAAGCPVGVARCCQPDPCPGPVVCDVGDRRCSDDGDSLEVCNECQNGFDVSEECTLRCIAIAGSFLCDLPGLPGLPL